MMSLFVAALAIAGTLFCFRTTASAPFHYGSDHVRLGLVEQMKLLAGNKPFVLLLVIKMLQLTALAVTLAAMPFLFQQILLFTVRTEDRSVGKACSSSCRTRWSLVPLPHTNQ